MALSLTVSKISELTYHKNIRIGEEILECSYLIAVSLIYVVKAL